MESVALLDCAGRRRSPATLPGFHRDRSPRNKGLRYPPDPPSVEEIIAVMRAAGEDREGLRLRGMIVVLWRAGLRIGEALALAESDLDRARGAILVRSGKGGRRREGHGPLGVGATRPMVGNQAQHAGRCAVLHPARPHPRTALSSSHGSRAAARRGRSGGGQATLRPAPAAPCARGRDVARRRAPAGHSAPTRARQPVDHLGVPPRDRQHRDHPHRTLAPRADDPRRQRPPQPRLS